MKPRQRAGAARFGRAAVPEALEPLLEIVRRGRGEAREAARLQILSALELLAGRPETVST